jgi:hypothetical protein
MLAEEGHTTTKTRAARVFDMPLHTLRERAHDARRSLAHALALVGTVGGLRAVDATLDRVEHLLPGLMDRAEGGALLAVHKLDAAERAALHAELRAGREARLLRARVLDGVSALEVLDALDRLEVFDAIAADVMRILRAIETEYANGNNGRRSSDEDEEP